MNDQVSHTYKTTGKIKILCIIIFTFLASKLEDKGFCQSKDVTLNEYYLFLTSINTGKRVALDEREPSEISMAVMCAVCLRHSAQFDPVSHSTDTGAARPYLVTDHTSVSRTEAKNAWRYTSTIHSPAWPCA
jgi:hypothetical protein